MGEVAEEKSRVSIQTVLSSADPILVAGLGFFQISMSTRWLPLNGGAIDAASGIQSLVLLSCFVAILIYALFLAFHSRVSLWLSSLGWKVAVGILAVAGVAAVSLEAPLTSAGFASFWFVATAVLTGMGSATLLMTWAVRCIDSSSLLNFPFEFLLAALGLAAAGLFNLSGPRATGISVSLAVLPTVISAALLFFAKEASATEREATLRAPAQGLLVFMVKVGLGALMVSMANEMVKLIRPEGLSVVIGGGLGSWITIAVMLVVAGGIVHQLRSGKPSGFYFLCKGAIVLCIFGALLFPYAGSASSLLFSISSAGRQCLQLLVWIIVFLVCRKHQLSPVVFFGFMSVAWYGGSLAGSALFDALQSMERLSSVWGAELVSVMAVLLLVVAYVFLFSEKDSDLMFGEERASKKERAFHKACERLSAQGRLTAREQEVFYLLAKGAPVSTIEEKLYISGSTVSTHMKHIYQKLGVHSRGELYDMVDESLKTLPLDK